ncbi:MAG: hypothetical protein IJZ42_01960 [Lachnospiraceae bacterium]|nr:hypothetical protein [Lachnospiraceae bacterium]
MKTNRNEFIYVVLIKALTGLGGFARKFGNYEYTHIAVACDRSKNDFVTFSRRRHHTPFDAGFMHEKAEYYAFGKHKRVKIKMFAIPVTAEAKEKIEHYIAEIEKDRDYIFNLYSMVSMPLLHGFRIYKAHNCMSFTAKIVELSGAVELSKPYYKYNIRELDSLLHDFFRKEGYLYKRKESKAYMKNPGLLYNIVKFAQLNGKLIYRMIFRKKETGDTNE